MSVVAGARSEEARAWWIAVALAICGAWIAGAVWTAARPEANPVERARASASSDPAAAASVRVTRDPLGEGDPVEEAPPAHDSYSGSALHETFAGRLVGEVNAHAQRRELLARRRLEVRSAASKAALDLRMRELLEDEVERLTARILRDLRTPSWAP